MRRPPDRKFVVLAAALLVAASSALLSRPAIGTDGASSLLILSKVFGKS